MCFSTLLLRLTLKNKYFELQISDCEIVENLFHSLFRFIKVIKKYVSEAKMVVLSKAQQRNKKIETLIDDLWDLNKHGIEFKFEMK